MLDSRGNPTVQADVYTKTGFGRFTVPSGASKGRFEAYELRDTGMRPYGGMGVSTAVGNINRVIAPAIKGLDTRDQIKLDRTIIALDGTERKERLGSNALLAVSLAAIRAASEASHQPLYRYLSIRWKKRPVLPLPMMNILNGGKHAGNDLAFQEFMILPAGFKTFTEAIQAGVEIYHTLGRMLTRRYGKTATNVGDEGGFAPSIKTVRLAIEIVEAAIQESGYANRREVLLGIDPASASFYDEKTGKYTVDGEPMTLDELYDFYRDLVASYGIRSIEDPFQDEEFEGFSRITQALGKTTQIVGDDLFVTNAARVRRGVAVRAGNALLVKLNQAGTLTETIEAMDAAREAGYGLVMSHRSGDTEDTAIADLAVGLRTGQIKTGAPARGERTAKYNRLIQIEEELDGEAVYYGPIFLEQHGQMREIVQGRD